MVVVVAGTTVVVLVVVVPGTSVVVVVVASGHHIVLHVPVAVGSQHPLNGPAKSSAPITPPIVIPQPLIICTQCSNPEPGGNKTS